MAMQFVVPQFIEVESKIIGPISVRQFIILLVTAGFVWLFWEMFTFWLAATLGVFSFAVGGSFAFIKVNSQPLHIFMLSLIQTLKNPRLKVWHRELTLTTVTKKGKKDKKQKEVKYVPKTKINKSRLTELSLLVDTGGVYRPEELAEKIKEKKSLK